MTFVIQLALVGVTMGLIGFVLGRDLSRQPIDIKDIDGYIQKRFPDVWTAYHEGITEGYQQGLRDGRDQE